MEQRLKATEQRAASAESGDPRVEKTGGASDDGSQRRAS